MELEKQLPDWLSERVSELPRLSSRVADVQTGRPAIGDIFVITPGKLGTGVNRLAAVVDLDESFEAVQCALLTNETEYACDWDVRLTADELDLPYDLMVECDIVSSVWWKQLGQRIGNLPHELAPALWPRRRAIFRESRNHAGRYRSMVRKIRAGRSGRRNLVHYARFLPNV